VRRVALQCGVQKWYVHWRKRPALGPTLQQTRAAHALLFDSDGPISVGHLVPLVYDVGQYTFAGMTSSLLFALQFALFTGVDRLFIVGYRALTTQSAPRFSLLSRVG
jgi:hypothetical protein